MDQRRNKSAPKHRRKKSDCAQVQTPAWITEAKVLTDGLTTESAVFDFFIKRNGPGKFEFDYLDLCEELLESQAGFSASASVALTALRVIYCSVLRGLIDAHQDQRPNQVQFSAEFVEARRFERRLRDNIQELISEAKIGAEGLKFLSECLARVADLTEVVGRTERVCAARDEIAIDLLAQLQEFDRSMSADIEFIDLIAKNGGATAVDPIFAFTTLQCSILEALDGRALTVENLATAIQCRDPARLYKPGALKELRQTKRVKWKRGVGMYRPDRPPELWKQIDKK